MITVLKQLSANFSKFICLYLLATSTVLAAETVDWIVAIVNDQPILNSEVQQELEIVLNRAQNSNQAIEVDAQLKREIVRALITNRLQRQRAAQLNISVNSTEVDDFIQRIATRNNVSPVQLAEFDGLSLGELRQRVAQELIISRALEVDNKNELVNVPAVEINEMLRSRQGNENQSEYLIERVIFDSDQRDRANQLLDLSTDEFIERAALTQASTGPKLGWLQLNDLPSAYQVAVVNLETGESPPVIEMDDELHVLRLVTKRPIVVGQVSTRALKLRMLKAEAVDRQQMNQLKVGIVRGEVTFEQAAAEVNGQLETGEFLVSDLPPSLFSGIQLRQGTIAGPIVLDDELVLVQVLDIQQMMLGDEQIQRQIAPQFNSAKLQRVHQEWIEGLRIAARIRILRDPS